MNGTRWVMVLALVLGLWAPADAAEPATVTVKVRVDDEAAGYEGYRAMDGDPQTMWHTRFGAGEKAHPHEIVVDLGRSYEIEGFACLPRTGGGNGTINDYECCVGDDPKDLGKPVAKGALTERSAESVVRFAGKVKGRYLRLRALSEVAGRPWTSIAELRVLVAGVTFRADRASSGSARRAGGGARKPALAAMPPRPVSELDAQYLSLAHDLRNRARFAQYANQVHRPESLIAESDRDPADVVLRRTAALLADLKRMPAPPDLSALEAELAKLRAAGEKTPIDDAEARRQLFDGASALRRKIAFSNPLLSFDQVLFIKRHRSTFNHMCDQYYGINALPGGGVYVLSGAFGPTPTVRDVLADSVVPKGRLAGQKLTEGSFLSPDLSYDAGKVLFAYVECDGDRGHNWHTETDQRGYWSQGRCYHLFQVNADGTGLVQLTDGTWNDFDPTWLPNGRIAFISERRGGYLRCGRVCPTYTLYDLGAEHGDIRRLSAHETNEWHPSVTHDGTIVYTRWDYVDRHGCTAHLPWITTLDGRDSRAVHGNFAPRGSRPDMELDVRAVPGSRRFVATAAPHHGQAFGSLVMVDADVEDDDRMAPVRRITPDVAFPESQGGEQAYATAWPLGEDYLLCVYDPLATSGGGRMGMQGRNDPRNFNYGIYLVDSFGNKELIYRDPNISCLSPIPFRPRPMPPIAPPMIADGEAGASRTASAVEAAPAGADENARATLAVMNVYDGLKPWPEGTRIAALRVYKILPMSVPSGGPPHEVGLRLPSGTDSVMLARYVLGTVPVEADGSAHFEVPAEKEIFFQALDERGLAVQSMRSATYLKKGERLTCQGCHDRRHRAPAPPTDVPLALRRAPSRLVPDVDGSNPFSYPRLVQPVLDRNCVPCHMKHTDKAPDLTSKIVKKGRTAYYASYMSLAPKYGFWNYGNGHRTTPGQFGARASKLFEMLEKGHNKLKLPPGDLHRITLWLDSCSVFYGVYEKDGGEAQLRGEIVQPTLE